MQYIDYRQNPSAWADKLDVSLEAIQIYLDSHVIDTHICSFIWSRIFGYDLKKMHRPLIPGSPILNQVDFPRIREAQMSGVVMDITTNPVRDPMARFVTLVDNIATLKNQIDSEPELELVSNYAQYLAARTKNKTACWMSIQGGQALDHDVDFLDQIPEQLISRITLIHFTTSRIGHSNFKTREKQGLSSFGKEFVQRMNDLRIIVDLSHINPPGFFDAVEVHKKDVPFIVSHTGIKGVRDIWRNIGDAEIDAVEKCAGVIGIIYQPKFITKAWYSCSLDKVIDHMAYVIDRIGDDHVCLGSDYDGFITLPWELKDITYQPRLVQLMLNRGWSADRIKKILGDNYLRVVKAVNPS